MHQCQKDSADPTMFLRRLTPLALLLPVLLFLAAALKDHSAILANAKGDGVKIVALLHEQAEHLFFGHQIILDMIVNRVKGLDWDTIQARTGLMDELEVMDRRLDGESEILLVDAGGRIRATSVHSEPNKLLPPADRRCFLALSRNESQYCISQPYADPAPGHYLFSLSRRLVRDGMFDGIAQVAISADYIAALWASTTPSASDIVTLFKSDGTVLAQSGPPSPAGPSRPDLGKLLSDTIGASDRGIIEGRLFGGGAERITVYARVGDQPVYIALSLDKGAILETWYTNLSIYGLVAASATAGIVLALACAFRRAKRERWALSRWQAEIEERLKMQEQLRQSQKMESLGKLTGGIAHDFNNLLTVIVGNLGLMKRLVPEGKGQEYLQTALKAGDSAVHLTTRLLSFARKRVLEPRAIDLPQLVHGMEGLLLRTLGPNIRLLVSAERGIWPALVDPNETELIILNLAINARDAMPTGGTLTISGSNGEAGLAGAPRDLAPGQYVILTVSDTGIGMDATTLARATEPFFSTKEAGRGTGLGLSMMQSFVTQSGGTTRLRSQPGRGTRIELWLPRAWTSPEALQDCAVHDQPKYHGAILVCDDDPAVLQFICNALETKGYKVFSATGGRTALSLLEKHKSIGLLVLDFTMAEMNGAAVINELRVSRPDVSVLLMTGNVDPEAIQGDLPDVAMLIKPFDHNVLTRRVADMLKPPGVV